MSARAEPISLSGWWREAQRTWVVRWGRKLMQRLQARPARRLRVSETLSLGEKRQLLLVECGDRQLLIGAAGNFLTTLAELRPAAGTNEDPKENGGDE